MQWDKQTAANMNGWFGTSQKIWENWWDALAGSTQNGNAGPSYTAFPYTGQPRVNLWEEMAKQWQATMEQSLHAFSPEMAQSAQMAMQQFLFGQEYAQQLVKMTADGWQTMLVKGNSPEEWQQALAEYVAQLRSQMADAADVNKFMGNSAQLWQLFGQEMQKLSQPWLHMWMQFPHQVNTFAGSQEKAHPLIEMMNLTWDTYYQTFGRMTNMPSMGLMREFNEKVNRSFTIWQENQRISIEYQTILGDAMLNASEAYLQKLLELAQTGEVPSNQNALLTLWVEVADDLFIELFHSERYAEIQSRYVNSSMALRQQQRELTEIMLRMNDLPTRSDLDEAHKNIFQLRKEVKALKKALDNVSHAPQPAAVSSTESTSSKAAGTSAGNKRKATKPATRKPAANKRSATKAATATSPDAEPTADERAGTEAKSVDKGASA